MDESIEQPSYRGQDAQVSLQEKGVKRKRNHDWWNTFYQDLALKNALFVKKTPHEWLEAFRNLALEDKTTKYVYKLNTSEGRPQKYGRVVYLKETPDPLHEMGATGMSRYVPLQGWHCIEMTWFYRFEPLKYRDENLLKVVHENMKFCYNAVKDMVESMLLWVPHHLRPVSPKNIFRHSSSWVSIWVFQYHSFIAMVKLSKAGQIINLWVKTVEYTQVDWDTFCPLMNHYLSSEWEWMLGVPHIPEPRVNGNRILEVLRPEAFNQYSETRKNDMEQYLLRERFLRDHFWLDSTDGYDWDSVEHCILPDPSSAASGTGACFMCASCGRRLILGV